MSSARSMTCASRQRRRGPAPSRSHVNTGRSSSYTPNLAIARGVPSAFAPRAGAASARVQGYFVDASSVARVRLSPTLRPSASTDLASSRVRIRSVCALPSKPPAASADLVERPLAVVPERRVPQVVGEGGGLHDVGVAAELPCEVPRHLRHLEGVGQPVADEVVALRPDHLGLGRQPAQRGAVHDAGAVPLERRTRGQLAAARTPSVRAPPRRTAPSTPSGPTLVARTDSRAQPDRSGRGSPGHTGTT